MNSDVRNFYMRLSNGGVITASAKRNLLDGSIKVGLSFCSPKDRFVRDFGRKIAQGRMEKAPFLISGTNSARAVKSVLYRILEDKFIRKASGIPSWVPKELEDC